jgi:hypothetical protein
MAKIVRPQTSLVDDSDVAFNKRSRAYVEGLFTLNTNLKAGNTLIQDLPDDYTPIALIEAEGEFDLSRVIKKGLDPVTGMPRDLKIPEGDFKEAPNYYEFCTKYVGKDTKMPFARQLWMLLTLFGEICPQCSHPKTKDIFNVPVRIKADRLLEKIQLLEYGKCPKCKGEKHDFVRLGLMNNYVELACEAGQRAGKSTLVSSGVAYLLHKYLMYPRLSSVCSGIQNSTTLYGTFIGYRMMDAMALLWMPILDVIEDSKFFLQYHEMLDHFGKRYGIEFYRKKDIYLRYATKGLELYAAGPSKRGLRGRTRFISACDEIGWFPLEEEGEDRERAGGKEVYTALDRSLLTIRREVRTLFNKGYNNFLPALALNISSPSSQTDMIHTLVRDNLDSKRTLALKLATWEMSAIYTRQDEEIVDAYRKNPVTAERDYGANPPLTSSPFMDVNEVRECFKGPNRIVLKIVEKDIDGRLRIGADIQQATPLSPCPPSLLALDASFAFNSFAFVIMHATPELIFPKGYDVHNPQNIKRDPTPIRITVDAAFEIMPRAKTTLHYNKIYLGVIKPIIERFNIKYVFADRWNSLATLHRAEEEFPGLVALQYSVKYKDFLLTRSYLHDRKMDLPTCDMPWDRILMLQGSYQEYFENCPIAHLAFQISTVKDKGNTVIKGDKFTDDIFRALVLGTSRIIDPKIKEQLDKFSPINVKTHHRIYAIAAGRSVPMDGNLPQVVPIDRKFVITPDQSQANRIVGVVVRSSGGGFSTIGGGGTPPAPST